MPSQGHTERQPLAEDISPEARIQWLEQRAAALERQVEYRIRQTEALEQRLGEVEDRLRKVQALEPHLREAGVAGQDVGLLVRKARQYEELMQTKTMRILRRPRAAYGWLLRRWRERSATRASQPSTAHHQEAARERRVARADDREHSHPAFRTWEARDESLTAVESRIHDGVPREQLHRRADEYLDIFEALFPESRPPPGARLMEVGPGVGYIMEAALRRYSPKKIVGLDIAAGMIEKAQQRLERDGVDVRAIEFVHYDGARAPLPSDSFDFIYSVASLQHAPRPYCFRAITEAHRLIKPSGDVFIQLLSYSHFKEHITPELFDQEIERQIRGDEDHWHHYYAAEEIDAVLRYGIGVKRLRVREQGGSLFVCFGA
jgi:SAM-dependent methyltransferase